MKYSIVCILQLYLALSCLTSAEVAWQREYGVNDPMLIPQKDGTRISYGWVESIVENDDKLSYEVNFRWSSSRGWSQRITKRQLRIVLDKWTQLQVGQDVVMVWTIDPDNELAEYIKHLIVTGNVMGKTWVK